MTMDKAMGRQKSCAWSGDLNRGICRSRQPVDRCSFNPGLWTSRLWRCVISGRISRCAMPWLLRPSVMMRRGLYCSPRSSRLQRGRSEFSVCGGLLAIDQAMTRVRRSLDRTANWILAVHYARAGIVHFFSGRFNITNSSFSAASSAGKVAAGANRMPQLGVERLDGVGGVEPPPDLDRKGIERHHLAPGASPALVKTPSI